MASPLTALADFLEQLRRRTSGDVRTDEYSRLLYSTDASIYQVKPHGVFLPKVPDEIDAAVELAAQYAVTLLPRTGGSSLAGQAVGESLVIDFTRHLNRILEVNREEKWVRVQPGVVLDQLNLHLRPYGLQFGPDPASSNRAAMGGIVSNNSTGSHSIRYGMTADYVRSMRVLLADGSAATFEALEDGGVTERCGRSGLEGEIYSRMATLTRMEANRSVIRAGTPRHWRRCGGYNLDRFVGGGVNFQVEADHRFNLARLVCGAEGTLAVIKDVTLDLVEVPDAKALAIVQFDSMAAALTAVPVILETDPSAIELLDNLGLTLCRGVPEYARLLEQFIDGKPDCILITEFYGKDRAELSTKIDSLRDHVTRQGAGATAVLPVLDPQRQEDVWTVRKVGLGLLMSIKGDHKPIPFIEDAAVPTEHLASYVAEIDRFCSGLGTRVAYYAHASAGCVHIRPLINTKAAEEIAKLPEITSFTVELLRGYGGALSSEHGDGRARSWINERFFGKDLYRLYQEVKRAFDPKNILNPGNVVDAGPMDCNLRFGADYDVIPLEVNLDFTEEMGFHRAVEMCNGAGICRKETVGTMCPSYMVTREEEHSTRGRANALRAALSGRLPKEELTSRRMHDVMDLCVECKACKAECPSSVDIAKIKFEFLAQYHAVHGPSIRDRMFGGIARTCRMASGPVAAPVNGLLRMGIVRRVLEKTVGISRNRTLPAFARTPFTTWLRERAKIGEFSRRVVLFTDTFTTYNEPHVAVAATDVLEAAGFEVTASNHGCCGRPMISKGLVDDARAAARATVDTLFPLAKAGLTIVGLEPSCLLSLRDEYLYLLPGDERVQTVANAAVTFEEFIDSLAEKGEFDVRFTAASRRVLLHGHCHQKALVGSAPSHRILGLPGNYEVSEVDSGCCGMAGSFGYEAEHYDISMRMAERRLLPAVREEDDDTLIVAAGISCRHQIRHGTGRVALHPAEVLRDAAVGC